MDAGSKITVAFVVVWVLGIILSLALPIVVIWAIVRTVLHFTGG